MNARAFGRLARLLAQSCPREVDPVLWRQCQEAVREATTPATATGQPWPPEGYADTCGPSREESYPRRWPLGQPHHARADRF